MVYCLTVSIWCRGKACSARNMKKQNWLKNDLRTNCFRKRDRIFQDIAVRNTEVIPARKLKFGIWKISALSTDADSSTDTIKSNPIQNTSPFLRLHWGTIRNRTRGRPMSPIRKTSSFLRLQTGTILESNPEHLLVFKAPRRDNPRVQSGTPPCF